MTACPCEEVSQHAQSPALVGDAETVCRGAYAPLHFNKSGIKVALIRASHLANGELSVWRLLRDPAFDAAAIAAELARATPDKNELRAMLAAEAGRIRRARMPDHFEGDQQVFCVSDDCSTDDQGGWHREHATIGLAAVEGFVWDVDSDVFEAARQGLLAIFKAHKIWPAPEPLGD